MKLNRLIDGLNLCAETQPNKNAIEFQSHHITYRHLQRRVVAATLAFDRHKINRGDRVALLALNSPDWFVLLFAAAQRGIILVPMNWRLSASELAYVLEDASPSMLLHDEEFHALASKLQSQFEQSDPTPTHTDHDTESDPRVLKTLPLDNLKLDELSGSLPDNAEYVYEPAVNTESLSDKNAGSNKETGTRDPLLIVYTSGTTGRPKGAVLDEKALLCSAAMSRHMLDLSTDDRVLNVLPLFHVGGLNIQPLPALLYGATVILHQRFDAEAAASSLSEDSITLVNTVPTVLQSMLASPGWPKTRVPSMRTFSIGSTDVPVSLISSIHEQGYPLIQVYGATETGPVAIYQRITDANVVGTIGRAGCHCEVRLVDTNNNDVKLGQPGEILVKGDNTLLYYWGNRDATVNSIENGWFKTGDVASEDENGFYWFNDRLKHVVISGGENIYPAEIERLVRVLPGVDGVAVVGKPDERWGEVPVVVIEGSANETAVLEACSVLARFKQPKAVITVDALPRNALGKIQVQVIKDTML